MKPKEQMSREELEAALATYEHLDHIRRMLRQFADALLERGETHDRSKLGAVESETFAEYTPKLKGLTYGSDEYKACLAAMGPELRHHYACNRHHPEHFADGVRGMNLIDLLEMFIDWRASTLRHADGDMLKSIEVSTARFGLDPQLVAIFVNTEEDLRRANFGSNHPSPVMGEPRANAELRERGRR